MTSRVRTRRKPVLAVTLGDAGGIGPAIAWQAVRDPSVHRAARILLIGDARVLPGSVPVVDHPASSNAPVSLLDVRNLPPGLVSPGGPGAVAGRAAAEWVQVAASAARLGQVDGVVTAPVSKLSLSLAGLPYPGHTEMLQAFCGVRRVGMMLASGPLRFITVTRHCALAEVPRRLTAGAISDAIHLGGVALRRWGITHPRIGVCGLNPHAGDGGRLGNEERRIIAPAVRRARALGWRVSGPAAADAVIAAAARGDYDLVVAQYHDQAMIPLKALSWERCVNITIGLPFPRTSPGHGTAFDLVRSRTRPDPRPMREAILVAARLAAHRRLG